MAIWAIKNATKPAISALQHKHAASRKPVVCQREPFALRCRGPLGPVPVMQQPNNANVLWQGVCCICVGVHVPSTSLRGAQALRPLKNTPLVSGTSALRTDPGAAWRTMPCSDCQSLSQCLHATSSVAWQSVTSADADDLCSARPSSGYASIRCIWVLITGLHTALEKGTALWSPPLLRGKEIANCCLGEARRPLNKTRQ